MKILITGVSGFLGNMLAVQLLRSGHFVYGVDFRVGDFAFAEHPNFEFINLDLTKPEALDQLPWDQVELLYHLAAAGVKAATREWPLCIEVNVIGTAQLFESLMHRIARSQTVPRIVYCKSYYEDQLASVPDFRENPYVISKIGTTSWVKALVPIYPSSITIAKVFQVYGPGDDPDNVLSYAVRKLKSGKKASFGSGKSLRDWIYIDDFITGLVLCGVQAPRGLWRYDLGSGERYSLREVVGEIAEICGADPSLLEFDESKDRGDSEIEDWAKIKAPGFRNAFSLHDGLCALVKGTR